jgi:tryptophanyl-tRNA synthetase
VGKDQEQHLEMARTFANRFNRLYQCDYFTEPYAFSSEDALVKIPGLDGKGKMGKSEGGANAIYLSDSEEAIRKKVMKAVTDNGVGNTGKTKSEPVQNLFTLMETVSPEDTVSYFEAQYQSGAIRYGDLKKQLAEDIIAATRPIRERIAEIAANKTYLREVAEYGAVKARENAAKTIREVREIIGFRNF